MGPGRPRGRIEPAGWPRSFAFVEYDTGMLCVGNVAKYALYLRSAPGFNRGCLFHVLAGEHDEMNLLLYREQAKAVGILLSAINSNFGYWQIEIFRMESNADRRGLKSVPQIAETIVHWFGP